MYGGISFFLGAPAILAPALLVLTCGSSFKPAIAAFWDDPEWRERKL